MSQNAVSRLIPRCCSFAGGVNIRSVWSPVQTAVRNLCDSAGLKDKQQQFDASVLQFLVCPLSKKPLRYEETTNELINEELGIAYPIIDGIPNMIPQDARLIKKPDGTEEPAQA